MVLWGCPTPRGYLSVSSVSPEEHGIEGPVPRPPGGPLVGPAQPPVHLPHQGRVSSPRGSGTAPQSRSHGLPPSAPRAGPPRCPCACGANAAPRPPSAEAIRAGSALGAGGAGWCRGRGSGPLTTPPDGRGGAAAWQSRPRGPAIGWGVAPFPRPPLPRPGPSCRPSLGPLIPPAVVARRWPAGGGREG